MFAHKQKGCSLLLKAYGMKDIFIFLLFILTQMTFSTKCHVVHVVKKWQIKKMVHEDG
jgi:hypothetical protein